MEADMMDNEELAPLIQNYRRLTPAQQELLRERVRQRAKILRSETFRRLFGRLRFWRQCRSAVAKLSALDDRMLKDIGLHRSGIEAAARGLPVGPSRVRICGGTDGGYGSMTPAA
jgi:uncharacterized protein YjiS (DUF1127 family)